MTVITNMPLYQAAVIARALTFYADTGMKVNRAYTPTAMLTMARKITGRSFKRGQYREASAALLDWFDARRAEGETLQTPKPPV